MRAGSPLLAAPLLVASCLAATPPPSGSSTPTATDRPSPSAVTFERPGTPVPTLRPLRDFAGVRIDLAIEEHPGQPAEGMVWTVARPTVDAAYLKAVTSALGVEGEGIVGAAPGDSAPWRLWAGRRVLAVNTVSGDVLFFDPRADDGPPGPGPARPDPAGFLERLVGSIDATSVDTTSGRLWGFRGDESASSPAQPRIGTFLPPGYRDTAVVFPEYRGLGGRVSGLGTTIYDTDDVALVTSRGRPVELIHRPLAGLRDAVVYPITTYRDAVRELRADPARFLRLVSADPGGSLALSIDPAETYLGSAWAGGSERDLTRLGQTLVPVRVFLARGTNARGVAVTALFVVDAVRPELRAGPPMATPVLDADDLLRTQLAVFAGHTPDRMDPRAVAMEAFGPGCSAPSSFVVNGDTASASASCHGAAVTATLKRAFPGLAESIWYVASMAK